MKASVANLPARGTLFPEIITMVCAWSRRGSVWCRPIGSAWIFSAGLSEMRSTGFRLTAVGPAANTIGGSQPGTGNVCSGNGLAGILLSGSAQDNVVLGNWIGTHPAAAGPLG